MGWEYSAALLFGGVIVLMFLGMPVAFVFLTVNVLCILFFWGGVNSFPQLIGSIFTSVSNFSFLPIPLFILMGDILFVSGVASILLDAMEKWMGRMPARLSLLSIGGGAVIGALTGVSMGSVALMGRILLPEMKKRGYQDAMTLGPIVCVGALALMIPPSVLAVVFGGLARISIGKILIAIIVPGILLAGFYVSYVLIRSKLQPSLAPGYLLTQSSLWPRLKSTAPHMLPVVFIIFSVTGLIFAGIATPSEAAATGAGASFFVVGMYGRLNWEVVKKSLINTINTTAMILIIISGAIFFSQNLAFTGVSRGLINLVLSFNLSKQWILVAMILIVLILGMFMEAVSLMMITIPVFAPLVKTIGIDPIWWAVTTLLAVTIGPITPPFGLDMFTLKGVAPPDVTMVRIYKAAIPFLMCDLAVLILLIAFPRLSTYLPSILG